MNYDLKCNRLKDQYSSYVELRSIDYIYFNRGAVQTKEISISSRTNQLYNSELRRYKIISTKKLSQSSRKRRGR